MTDGVHHYVKVILKQGGCQILSSIFQTLNDIFHLNFHRCDVLKIRLFLNYKTKHTQKSSPNLGCCVNGIRVRGRHIIMTFAVCIEISFNVSEIKMTHLRSFINDLFHATSHNLNTSILLHDFNIYSPNVAELYFSFVLPT